MILSDFTIRKYLTDGWLIQNKIEDLQIQPASIDLRLGDHYLQMKAGDKNLLQLTEKPVYEQIIADEVVIEPRSYILATTQEYVRLPENIAAFVQGRSSAMRLGLFLQNSGWVDPGFEGEITIALYNANNLSIKLAKGVRICQLVFAHLDQGAVRPYQGKYQGQRNATGSRVSMDKDLNSKN